MIDYQFWVGRYKYQAQWTQEIRKYVLKQIKLPPEARVLEVGCGSRTVINEFSDIGFSCFGVDIDFSILHYVVNDTDLDNKINADGYKLPFIDSSFELCFCHYLLLWLASPIALLQEMLRVTKKDGWICCFAEPDYLGRIDAPVPLEELGKLQNESLQKQGVNLSTGRHLLEWFKGLKLNNLNWGILGSHNNLSESNYDNQEWKMMEKDIENYLSADKFEDYNVLENNAIKTGNRIFFVPTFYTYAKKQ